MSALRSLSYYRRANLAVLLAAAVASAVLTGALLAGDSVRGSLRDLTLERLGGIDVALVTEGFFREALAAELAGQGGFGEVAPMVLARGSAVHGETQARASRVSIYGVNRRFTDLFGAPAFSFEPKPDQIFPSIIVNESLRRQLDAKVGDDILLSFELPSDIPRETLVGEKDAGDILASRRFNLAAVVPDRGLGGFSLLPQQTSSLNAFLPLAGMQRDLEQEGRANALLAAWNKPFDPPADAVRGKAQLDDLGLRLRPAAGAYVLETREFFLKPAAVETFEAVAKEMHRPARRALTYIATKIETRGGLVPYSTITALQPSPESGLRLLDGSPAPALADGEILLNRWTEEDLGAQAGDAVKISYLVLGNGGGLEERSADLTLRGVVAMEGLGADRTLTPVFPGIEEAEDIASWDPPFPIDLSLVRPKDEQYWDDHGPTPKAFVSEATGRRLWGTRFGDLTSVRMGMPLVKDPTPIVSHLRRELMAKVDLAPFGLTFRPVKRLGIAAAEGSTDFAGLFVAFSFFLILSALMLVGLLFSLGVEARAGELGLLLAVGYPVRAVRRRLLAEGAVIAGLGAILGIFGALGYAALLMAGLRTWWRGAVGTPYLFLHAEPASLAIGAAVSVLVVLAVIAWTVRRLARMPAPALLAGSTSPAEPERKGGRLARWLAVTFSAAFVLLLFYGLFAGQASSPELAFGIGISLLIAGLSFFTLRLRKGGAARTAGIRNLFGMAARNGAANPGRSLLSVALVACACFVLVTVAANRRTGGNETPEGTGGFALFAESDVPLIHDLNRREDQEELGLDPEAMKGVAAVGFRLVPGDDASCLNLYRPGRPRLLGVPPGFADRSRFVFRKTLTAAENPWSLLDQELGPGVVPVFADENSAMWILHLGLGQDLEIKDEAGRPLKLRLVALLERGFFQGELLISEASLLRHFPSRTGRSFFLLSAPPERVGEVSQALEEGLGRFGFDVSTTGERMASYAEVENTYLSTFQALGGFGLLLGTLGLGLVLLRGVIERRGELATLRAFGFRRERLAWMVTAENGLLLVLGIGLGTLSGLLASAPHLLGSGGKLPWPSLLGTLAAVFAIGLISCIAAVWSALRVPLLPVLKAER